MSPEPRTPGDENLDRLLAMSKSPPQLDADARARLLQRLQRSAAELHPSAAPSSAPGGSIPMSPRRVRVTTVASSALALAAAGALVWGGARLLRGGPEGHVQEDSVVIHTNPSGRPRSTLLADGSTALLRAGAELRELGSRRLELVAGEVLLDVRAGPGAFTVASAAGEVEVRGTKFLLRQAEGGGEVFAGVLRGEVRLRGGSGEQTLKAGESGVLAPGAAPTRRAAPRLSHEVEWARDAMSDPSEELAAVRRGNLLARFPGWPGEFPLDVRVMDVDVVVEDGVARTTIDQTFFNQTDFQLEGVYSFPLPPDAAIARMAMYVDGKRMEAGITERQEGREIYESIVYRRRDPALLEWMQGNEFRVRIFPLPARTEKRILLSYTQPLASLYGDYSVRVPIPELDHPVGTLRYRVHVKDRDLAIDSCCVAFTITDAADERLAEAVMHDVPIGEDLALKLYPKKAPASATLAVQPDPGGDYVMVRARPTLPQASEHTPRRWVVLHDTSASRSPVELAAQSRFLGALLRELDEADRVALLAFDTTVRALPGGFARVDALDRAAVEQFLARAGRDHVGGTELGRALDEALALLAADGGPEAPHILYVGDGLAARDDAARGGLRDRVAGKATFVAATVGDEVDVDLLDELTAATGGLRVQVTAGAELGWQALDLAAALNTTRLQGVRARLLGEGDAALEGRVHSSATSLADGEALVVLARRTGSGGPDPKAVMIEGTLGGAPWSQRIELPPGRRGAGYAPRLWARAQVAADVRAGAEANKEEITALGLEHFLVTPFTSLLVLENEAMYRQFKVRRPDGKEWAHYDAPDEIKVVREPVGSAEAAPGQLVLRQPIPLLHDPQQYRPMDLLSANTIMPQFGIFGGVDDMAGGGLGLRGIGRGGGGTGEGTIGLGNLGIIGSGRPTTGEALKTKEVKAEARLDFVSTADLRQPTQWERATTEAAPMAEAARGSRSGAFVSSFDDQARRTRHSLVSGPRRSPAALHYLGDVRLGDLSEHVPALFEDSFDRERERLIATGVAASGRISPAARELLAAARAAARPEQYAVEGGVLRVEADGRFTRTRQIGGYLREIVVYDGERLTASYPELDLAVERRVGLVEAALLAQWVPWRLPSPEALARWYEVELEGAQTLRLALPGGEEVIRLELDAERRLVSVRHHRGAELLGERRFEYDPAGVTIVDGARRVRVAHSDATPERGGAEVRTRLALPLRAEADLVQALAEVPVGGEAWRALQRQRLAVLSALGQHGRTGQVLAEMRAQGPLTRGELVLGGAGLLQTSDAAAAAALSDLPGDPVAAYLSALRQAARHSKTGLLDQVARERKGSLPGLLASHARVLADVPRGPTPAALEHLRGLLAYGHAELALVATTQLAGYGWRRPEAGAKAWDLLAETLPALRPVALHGAGGALWYAGKYVEASERFERSLAAARELGVAPPIDWTVRSALQHTGGQAGWRLEWSAWRDAVRRSGEGDQVIAFLSASQQLGEIGEVRRVLAGLDLSRFEPWHAQEIVRLLLVAGQTADAQKVLRGLLARAPEDPALLSLAATLAAREGRLTEAADLSEKALAAQETLPLGQLRASYQTIFDLRARVAQSITGATSQSGVDPLDRALDVAARWRAEDPDNAAIDERCAELLFSLGQPEEALRHLDSVIERHPGEGAAYGQVAEVLEREGRVEDADRRWRQAVEVEPTNPTWLFRRAQNLVALGDVAQARALVRQVEAGKWQDRFFAVTRDARQLAQALDRRR